MFTGIVQNQGTVIRKQKKGGIIRFTFKPKKKDELIKPGESIAVNGTCLTTAAVRPGEFDADVIRETLQATTLGELKLHDQVNLERSLKTGDRIGGHFVTGHVDGRGVVKKIERYGRNRIFSIEVPKKLMRRFAVKGSVAVDGISLTIQAIENGMIKAALVPHTLKETTLGRKKNGDSVNLEIDLIARYLNILSPAFKKKSSRMTTAFLKKRGF